MVIKRNDWPYKCVLFFMIAYYSGLTDAFLPFVDDRVFLFGGLLILLVSDIIILGKVFSTGRIKVFDTLYSIAFICVIGLCGLYTALSGYARPLHIITYAISCFLPLLLLPLLYSTWNSDEVGCCWLDLFINLVCASIVLRIFNFLLFELLHVAVFPNVLGAVRGGCATAKVYALDVILFFIELYRGVSNYRETNRFNKDAYICLLVLLFVSVFARGRMQILCTIASFAIFFLFLHSKGGDKLLATVILIAISSLLLFTPYSKDLISTVIGASSDIASIDYDGSLLFQGAGDNTASIRLFSIKHGWEMMAKNPNGMGLVYYGSQRFKEFFPMGSNDDLGYIGSIFTYGFSAALLIAPLIIWGVKQSFVVRKLSLFSFRLSIVAYLLLTGISLSLFDLSRIGALPFFIYLLSASNENLNTRDIS